MTGLTPFSPESRPHYTRRTVLQAGVLGTLGLNLPALLAGQVRGADPGRRAKSCIFIVQYGGAPQQDMWDLKPEAPENIRGAFRPIDTNVSGIRICEKMPRLAQRADRYCLVRSMTTNDGGHDGAMHICMTGNPRPTDQTPYVGSVVSKLAPTGRNLPSYVWIQNLAGDVKPWYLSGGVLGMAHSPLRVGNDLDNPSKADFRFTAFDPPKDVPIERQSGRFDLLRTLDGVGKGTEGQRDRVTEGRGIDAASAAASLPPFGRGGGGGRAERFSDSDSSAEAPAAFRRMQEKAHRLVTGTEARQAFDVTLESRETRDRYGRHPLGQNLLMARRLIEAGVRLATVVAWTGTPPGETFRNVQTWDMHGVLYKPDDSIFGSSAYGLSWALPRVDEAVSALLDDLTDRGMLDDTLVVMVGEFGRTPNVNARGRDHWPNCYSAMLAGGGIRGGQVYGASDPHAAYVKDKPVHPADLHATLYHALGIPPDTRFGPDGFSLKVSDGRPVIDLFG